jgi:arginine decarboxylase-like protein
MKQKVYKNCQSCGMPLKRDPEGGGTNYDGSKSTMYCSKCYVNGDFQNPAIDTAEKMQAFVKDKLKSMGFPGFIAGMFTKGIPKLERWKK